ncbi:MAG: hypothetical protein LBJ47_04570 [Tannerella sp.]|nr:hypothetical protein [Tannerella sp.]
MNYERCRDVARYVSTQKPNPVVIARRNDEAIADTGRDCFVPYNDESGLLRQPFTSNSR